MARQVAVVRLAAALTEIKSLSGAGAGADARLRSDPKLYSAAQPPR